MGLAFDWSHMDWAVFASTLVLALVTLGLVIFTRRLAGEAVETRNEMKLAREESELARLLAIRPRVVLDVKNFGAGIGFVTVGNIGGGPALELRGTLDFGGDVGAREIAFHTLWVGEKHEFMPMLPDTGAFVRLDELTAGSARVSLVGLMSDSLGNEIAIDESIDLADVWEITKVSNRHLPPDHAKKTVDELEKIRKTLEQLQRTGQNAYYRAWPPGDARD